MATQAPGGNGGNTGGPGTGAPGAAGTPRAGAQPSSAAPLAEMIKILQTFKKAMGDFDTGTRELIRDLKALENATTNTTKRTKKFEDELETAGKSLREHAKEARDLAKQIANSADITAEAAKEFRDNSTKYNNDIEASIKTIHAKNVAEQKELERNKQYALRRAEQDRKQMETSAISTAMLASRADQTSKQFASTTSAIDTLQKTIAKKIAEANAISATNTSDPEKVKELGRLSAEIADLTDDIDKASKSFDSVSKASKLLSDELTDRFSARSLSKERIAELNNLLSADKLSAEHSAIALMNLEQFNRMKAEERENDVKAEQERRRGEIRRQAAFELGDQDLKKAINRLKERSELTAKHLDKLNSKLNETAEKRNQAVESGDTAGAEQLNKEYAKTSQQAQQLRESLKKTKERHTEYEGVLKSGQTRQTLVGFATTTVREKFVRLASASELLATGLKMLNESIAQSTTGTANSFSEFFNNYTKSIFQFGVSTATFQEVMANSRLAQLTATTDGFNNALKGSSSKIFEYVGDRNEAMKITGGLYTAFANVGISSEVAKGSIDKLVPIIGQLSRVTGKTTAEMAKLVESYYTENEHRITMAGLSEDEKARTAEMLALQNLDIQSKGYSLEQARELQRENAKNRMKTTITERTRDQAVMQQQARLIASGLARSGDQEGAQKMMNGAERVRQINAQLAYGKVDPETQAKLVNERALLAGEMAKINAGIISTRGEQDPIRVAAEYSNKVLSAMISIANGGMDTIATQNKDAKKFEEAKQEGSKGMFGGAMGTLISSVQMVYEGVKSTPVQLGLILLAILASNQYLGKFGNFLTGKTPVGVPKVGGGGGGGAWGKAKDLAKGGAQAAGEFGMGGAKGLLSKVGIAGTILGAGFAISDYLSVGDKEKQGLVSKEEATQERKKIGAGYAGGAVGGWAGMVAGAKLGGMAGGLIGAPVAGVGAIPAAVVGSMIGGAIGMFGGSYLGKKAGEGIVDDAQTPKQQEEAKIAERQATIDKLTKEKSELEGTLKTTGGLSGGASMVTQLSKNRLDAVEKQLSDLTGPKTNAGTSISNPLNTTQSNLATPTNAPVDSVLKTPANNIIPATPPVKPEEPKPSILQEDEAAKKAKEEAEKDTVSSLLQSINQSIGQLIALTAKNSSKNADLVEQQQEFLAVATSTDRLSSAFNNIGIKFT